MTATPVRTSVAAPSAAVTRSIADIKRTVLVAAISCTRRTWKPLDLPPRQHPIAARGAAQNWGTGAAGISPRLRLGSRRIEWRRRDSHAVLSEGRCPDPLRGG